MTQPFDVNSVWQAIERVAKGGATFEPGEQEAVTWLQDQLGLTRGLETYAPRSRRRYRAASRAGQTARERNAAEYAQQKRRKQYPSGQTTTRMPTTERGRMSLIGRLVDERNRVLPDSVVDMEDVHDYILGFGSETVIEMLRSQLKATYFWIESNHEPGPHQLGHEPWFTRPFTQSPKPDFSDYISNTDVMYYYHGRRG